MDSNKENSLEKEIILEEYMLGTNYYNKIQEKAKDDIKHIDK